MEGFKFYFLFLLLFGCKGADENINRLNEINSISLKDKYNTAYVLENKELISFKKNVSKFEAINPTIFPDCYYFIFKTATNETIEVKTDGNLLLINDKYYYSKDNLITKYFNILEENFCNDSRPINIRFKIIKQIFENYIASEESTDSEANKSKILEIIEKLNDVENEEDLELLINMWMYYDPTDFNSRDLIFEVFKKNKESSIKAIQNRIENKKEWEQNESAPFSELFILLDRLQNL